MKSRPIIFDGESVRAILAGTKTMTRRVVKPQPVKNANCGLICYDPERGLWGHHFNNSPGEGRFPDGVIEQTAVRCAYGVPGDELWVRESTTYWERPDSGVDITPRHNESHRPADGSRYERWMNRTMPNPDEMPGEDFLVYKADGIKRPLGDWPFPHPVYEHCVGRFGKTLSPIHMPRWASRITLRVTDVRVERVQEINTADAKAEGVETDEFLDRLDEVLSIAVEGCGPVIYPTLRTEFERRWDSINAKRGFSWESNPWVFVVSFEQTETS